MYGSCARTPGVLPVVDESVPRVGRVGEPGLVDVQSGVWANPFRVGVDGTRSEVRDKYRRWLVSNPDLLARLPELRGKSLGVAGDPDVSHASILLDWANNGVPEGFRRQAETGVFEDVPVTAPIPASRVRPDVGPVRIVMTGSREWTDQQRMGEAIDWAVENARRAYPNRPITLVHGGARGADRMAAAYFEGKGYGTATVYPVTDAQWKTNPQGAGLERNARMMADGGHVVLAFHKDQSAGTGHAIREAQKNHMPVYRFSDDGGVRGFGRWMPEQTRPRTGVIPGTTPTFAQLEWGDGIVSPFDGINPALRKVMWDQTHDTPLREGPLPILSPYEYEDQMVRMVQANPPDWDVLATNSYNRHVDLLGPVDQGNPMHVERDTILRQPYTEREMTLAQDMYAEAMQDYINSYAARLSSNPGILDQITGINSEQLLHVSTATANQIDETIRLNRLGHGFTKPMDDWKARNQSQKFEGYADDVEHPERKSQKFLRNDPETRMATPEELAAAKERRKARFKNRPMWDDMSPYEQSLVISAAQTRGIRIDPDTGKRINSTPDRRPDQIGLDEQGNIVYPTKGPTQETDWRANRDQLDADLTSPQDRPVTDTHGSSGRGIVADTAPIPKEPFDGGVTTAPVEGGGSIDLSTPLATPPKTAEPARRPSISSNAYELLLKAEAIYKDTYGRAPQRIRKDKTGMEMYGTKTRTRMEQIITDLAGSNGA